MIVIIVFVILLKKTFRGQSEKMKEWVKKLVPTYTIDKRESVTTQFLKNAQEQNEQNLAKAE